MFKPRIVEEERKEKENKAGKRKQAIFRHANKHTDKQVGKSENKTCKRIDAGEKNSKQFSP